MTKGSEVWGRTSGSIFTLNSEHDGTQSTRRLVVQHRNAATEKFLLDLKDGLLEPIDEAKEQEETEEASMFEWIRGRETFTWLEFSKGTKCSGTVASARINPLLRGRYIKKHEKGRRVWFSVPSVIEQNRQAQEQAETVVSPW